MDFPEISIYKKQGRYDEVQFYCIVDEDGFFFVLAYELTDRPFDKNILNLTQFESTPE